jgi:hypothetical protein
MTQSLALDWGGRGIPPECDRPGPVTQRRGRDDRRRLAEGAGTFSFLQDMQSEEDWQALKPGKAR